MFFLPIGAALAAGAFIPAAGQTVIAGAALLLGAVSPVFISATGIAARGPDAAGRSRLFGILLRTEAILLCIALRIPFDLQQSEAFWGIPPERITSVSGILLGDSTPVEDGSIRFVLRAERVEDAWGNQSAAEAEVLITAAGSIPAELFLGTEAAIPVSLYQIHAAGNKWYGSSRGAVKVLKGPTGIAAVRRSVSQFIRNRLRSTGKQAAPLLEALLLGYRDIRADKLCELFRRTGAIHLLALSGMHLGVITMGVLVLLVPLLGRARAASAALIFICIYLFLVGPRPSLVRAVLMYGTGVTGYMYRRKRPPIFHLLVLSFFIQSTAFPGVIGTLGFQLSYLALGGILLFTETVRKVLPWWVPPPLSPLIAANLCAVLCTAPLLVKTFGVLYPVGLFASLVLTPLIILWMWIGILYLIWSLLCAMMSVPLLLIADLRIRHCIEAAAGEFIALVRTMADFPPLCVPAKMWPLAAGAAACLLTLLVLTQYAGVYGVNRELQFSQRDRTISEGQWNGPDPPVWAEFSHIPGGTGEDRRAA